MEIADASYLPDEIAVITSRQVVQPVIVVGSLTRRHLCGRGLKGAWDGDSARMIRRGEGNLVSKPAPATQAYNLV